jgi:hypothetical protein
VLRNYAPTRVLFVMAAICAGTIDVAVLAVPDML